MFLILRTRPSDALHQLQALRTKAHSLGIGAEDVQCPTYRIERRVGRDRRKIEVDVPVLGNFLFVQWAGDLYWANYLERKFPFVHIMRLPHGGYATCSDAEVAAINKLPALFEPDSAEWVNEFFNIGDEVTVKPGTFLGHIEGIIDSIKKNGEVRLKVVNSGRLKLTTLLVHGSLLTIKANAPA